MFEKVYNTTQYNTIQSKFIGNRRRKKAGGRARLLGRGAGKKGTVYCLLGKVELFGRVFPALNYFILTQLLLIE